MFLIAISVHRYFHLFLPERWTGLYCSYHLSALLRYILAILHRLYTYLQGHVLDTGSKARKHDSDSPPYIAILVDQGQPLSFSVTFLGWDVDGRYLVPFASIISSIISTQ